MARELPPARDAARRKRDVLERLAGDEDAWVATADAAGEPCLVPLSFVWHGGALVMTTRAANPTAVNAAASGRAVVSLGHTRDVVLIDARVEVVADGALGEAEGEAFVAKLAWDTRGRPGWVFLRFHPRAIRAWREVNELPGRQLMANGVWLVQGA
ncbi:pyridoxamine 5'-phosphate oxidase family protein [Streptomyces radicis]|uniref:Pyridoxamine 5'-phosphate oxidase n=1 Tax=Streptomyces radicis TaxID=1750517 RepID=A0A3A9WG31_9ACTN|nr:pyridoxamine 5'-phosphate oxidase family protein [Streptomyces radicis]RKN11915.1 pyridoxamine 5'-phosphate oxidase [Streptomyces radicis]RKN26035.1 pyridoxamine 5'-phosphate oxidase [Streptomyces radicis]